MTAPYTFEFEDGTVRAWHLTEDGAEPETVTDYRPALFVDGPADALEALRERLASDPKVAATGFERRRTSLRDDAPSRVLRAELERAGEVRTLAREIRGLHERERRAPGTLRLFDVDFTPGFRYCLDEGIDPTPDRDLRTLEIGLDEPALADRDVSRLRIDGGRVGDGASGGGSATADPADVLWSLGRRLEREDPDVLVLSHGDLVPVLSEAAAETGLEDFHLGRRQGWTRLAGESTYESYGQVGHSPARYRVPGRAIVDRSNSFLWHQSGLEGLEYLVGRSRKPLQEAAWASIGTVLTAMEIRIAREWNVLAPWNKWEPEAFTDVATLHAADRGGFTFAPEVGLHEDVREIDFASLYPRIICRHNVSPETIDCGCCGPDASATVPELGYEICEERGFLPAVLKPLLDDRAAIKRRLREDPPEDEAARLRARSGAIKWVLVSCFGYQGYRNAKFGRIECHEAINAYARDVLLTAKERLEAAGWRVVHGIVDSLWVTPRDDDPDPLADVIDAVSREVGIALECDGRYDWVCFVPLRESAGRGGSGGESGSGGRNESGDTARTTGTTAGETTAGGATAGALTKYFGKRESGTFKFRGVEIRQRSTPAFVADSQRAFVEALDRERDPEAVCDVLERRLGELRRGEVGPADLAITKRVSKPLADYRQRTRTTAALQRYERRGIERHPGQSVEYVVVDDDARGPERVRLEFEVGGDDGDGEDGATGRNRGSDPSYDADFYATLLIRACESVVSPLGWDRTRIRRYLADGRTVRLSAFLE